MSPFQITALVFVVAVPALVWMFDRQPHTAHLTKICERGLAAALVLAFLGELVAKVSDGTFNAANALPMQLCDWALFTISAALWWRWRAGFDVAYFWGLAGTAQALFTPAIPSDLPWPRVLGFFLIHAGIVAGVLHLLLTGRFRPEWSRSIVRLFIASEGYVVTALMVNALTGGNYGFLSHKPITRSMLDLFSDTHWLYVLEINLIAWLFFAVLYLPWAIADASRRRHLQ
ncbi:MAG: TIGR02206 family membrane protein [Chthoniobacter sp.]|uniref:TMEM164-related integral membrane acyltransferase n=1 Tax=Chthoniobacter sp. TaxID=2510640 RepID=UPI0032A9DCF6